MAMRQLVTKQDIKVRWQRIIYDYGPSVMAGYVGKWKVGSVSYSISVAQGDPKTYKVSCSLPGIKDNLGCYATEEEGQEMLQKAVTHWFSKIYDNPDQEVK